MQRLQPAPQPATEAPAIIEAAKAEGTLLRNQRGRQRPADVDTATGVYQQTWQLDTSAWADMPGADGRRLPPTWLHAAEVNR